MIFEFKALGIKQAQLRTERLGAAAYDLTDAWELILEMFFGIEEATFSSQGRRGGGSWAQDTPEWLARKAREGLDPRINFATTALYTAMTTRGAEGQIIEVLPQSLKFGTDLPQAGPSQANRPFIKTTETDRLRMREIIAAHFKAAWSAPV